MLTGEFEENVAFQHEAIVLLLFVEIVLKLNGMRQSANFCTDLSHLRTIFMRSKNNRSYSACHRKIALMIFNGLIYFIWKRVVLGIRAAYPLPTNVMHKYVFMVNYDNDRLV